MFPFCENFAKELHKIILHCHFFTKVYMGIHSGRTRSEPVRSLSEPAFGPDRATSRSCFQGSDQQWPSSGRTVRTGQDMGRARSGAPATAHRRYILLEEGQLIEKMSGSLRKIRGSYMTKKNTRGSSSATNLTRRPVDGDERNDG